MSFPVFVASGANQSNTDAISVPWPAHLVDDIGILVVQTANEAVTLPTGWTLFSELGYGAGGAAGSVRLSVFWKRATSAAEANADIADTGDHQRGRILLFRGCIASGPPFDGGSSNVEPSVTTAVSIPGRTTSVAECLVLALVANATDTTANQTASNGFTNASLANITRVLTGNGTTGVGGGIDGITGEKATAGLVDVTTTTLNTASAQSRVQICLKPPTPGGGGGGTVTEGGLWVATGGKATAGALTSLTATSDVASTQGRLTIALKGPLAPPVNLPPVINAISDYANGAAGSLVVIGVVVTDPEGDALTVTLIPAGTTVPAGATITLDAPSGDYIFEWTPTTDQVGEWNIAVQAAATGGTVSRAFTITVAASGGGTGGYAALARSIAERAKVDFDSSEALTQLLLEQEQINASVIYQAKILQEELLLSRAYMQTVIDSFDQAPQT